MSYIEFVEDSIGNLDNDLFCEFRNTLVYDYIPFALIKRENVTPEILKEKLCDYFEKVELKTGRSLEKMIDKYMSDIDSIVGDRIAAAPKAKKGEAAPIPRARRYYDRACAIRKENKTTKQGLQEYSRIMLCLYSAIIKDNHFKEVDNFDFSFDSVDLKQIIVAMRSETMLLGKITRFNTEDPFGTERCTFVIMIMMIFYIRSTAIVED